MAAPIAPPTTGEEAESTSVNFERNSRCGIFANWLMISPTMSEEKRPSAIALIASTKYLLKYFFTVFIYYQSFWQNTAGISQSL